MTNYGNGGVVIVTKDRSDLDIRSLKYFVSAAEHLNFTNAANECFITQTAMSMHIAKMEDDLGFDLFVRHNRKVSLTQAGEELYKSVKKIIRMYDNAITYSSGIAEGVEGRVRVVLTSSIDSMHFIDRFQRFKDENPDIILDLHIVEPREIIDLLKQREADVAFCWPHDFEDQKDYEVKIIDKSPICVALSPKHILAKKYKSISIKDLKDERVIAISEGGLPNSYHSIQERVHEAGFDASSIFKVHKLEEILINLEMNYGIAILPQYIEGLIPQRRIEFLGIEGSSPITFDQAAIYLKENPSPAMLKLLELFPEV